MADIKHTVSRCPFCEQKLRIPKDRGDLKLTCPTCQYKWDWIAGPVELVKSNRQAMTPAIAFQESDDFYKQLTNMLRTEEPFTIQTPYTKFSQLPKRFKRIVKSARRRNFSWGDSGKWGLSALTDTSRALIIACLIIIGTTIFGAASGLVVGTLFGDDIAAPGAFAGTLLGLLTGVVSQSMSQGTHQVEIEVDVYGRLIFRFNPVRTFRTA